MRTRDQLSGAVWLAETSRTPSDHRISPTVFVSEDHDLCYSLLLCRGGYKLLWRDVPGCTELRCYASSERGLAFDYQVSVCIRGSSPTNILAAATYLVTLLVDPDVEVACRSHPVIWWAV